MQARTTTPRPRALEIAPVLLPIAGIGLLVLLLLSFILETRPAAPGGSGGSAARRIAYFEFGITADTLWAVPTSDPSRRERIFSVPHAREYGVVPSVAPDGRSLVFASLPQSLRAPSPDAPADLWLTSVSKDARPRLLAAGVDLRVPAVWSPDAATVVFRRSNADGFALVAVAAEGGAERTLVETRGATALFPVAFAPDGSRLYFVNLRESGSTLASVEAVGGTPVELAVLSEGLTRDWSLSPDGNRLAFLAMNLSPDAITSRALVLDLESRALEPVTDAEVNAFGPVWSSDGALVVGTLAANGEASLARWEGGSVTAIPGPARGFDVPLGFASGGAMVVRAFSGASATAPGAATLVLIDEKGERHVIASGEVTFAGWSAP
jgi:Tol biopolymer transport system component